MNSFGWEGTLFNDTPGSFYPVPRRHLVNIGIFILTCFVYRNKIDQTVVIKSARHFRIANEKDILRKFQPGTPYPRPLVDEILEPADPPAIVLRHLEDDLLDATNATKLNRMEVRYVSKRVLEALKVLHKDGYVHTG